jgi:hypothetical protein
VTWFANARYSTLASLVRRHGGPHGHTRLLTFEDVGERLPNQRSAQGNQSPIVAQVFRFSTGDLDSTCFQIFSRALSPSRMLESTILSPLVGETVILETPNIA